RFPDLLFTRGNDRQLNSSGDGCARGYGGLAYSPADRRARFDCLLSVLKSSHQTSLMNKGSRFIDVKDPAGDGRLNSDGLQQGYDLRPARRIAKAYKRQGSVAAHPDRRVL